ncbi:hypothetical protein K1T73_09415 [Roseovarius sp. SCSIO 43702]|uniref:hypothetical protein n=1 Tax=Roseovarius sp. SCSIO 43702 TaxID=2823043 RepID=UPI001C72EC00|nr:hypothetical protein [Roseovarius sp. SCSIO 43702]QYX55334.1 hypothetical protein K1T73_09415 [Roseovarius sp. SCSIO 43702]
MFRPPLLAALLAALHLIPAHAGDYCVLDGTEMFACTFKNGAKRIEVCDAAWLAGDMVSYGFLDARGTVEKETVLDKASLPYIPWSGVGGSATGSVIFPSGDHLYGVWMASERVPDGEVEGGINVARDGAEIARLTCDPGSVTGDLPALIDMIDTAQISP